MPSFRCDVMMSMQRPRRVPVSKETFDLEVKELEASTLVHACAAVQPSDLCFPVDFAALEFRHPPTSFASKSREQDDEHQHHTHQLWRLFSKHFTAHHCPNTKPTKPCTPNARVHSASAHLRAGQAKAGACSPLKLSQKSHSACTRRHETQVNNNRIECCVQHSEERGSASGKQKRKLTRFSPL